MTWQPIETAPRDGRPVSLRIEHRWARYSADPVADGWVVEVVGRWIDHNRGGWTWHGLSGRPTHWMPLPEPPETKP